MGATTEVLSKSISWGEYILILVTLGTQDFPFDRLLKEIDRLIEENVITERVYAQIGYSSYSPKHFETVQFLPFEGFEEKLDASSTVITHAGTGTIVTALKKGKKVIAVSRLKKYGEHVDDHQTEIVNLFSEQKFILGVLEVELLEQAIKKLPQFTPQPYKSGNDKIIQTIETFVNSKL